VFPRKILFFVFSRDIEISSANMAAIAAATAINALLGIGGSSSKGHKKTSQVMSVIKKVVAEKGRFLPARKAKKGKKSRNSLSSGMNTMPSSRNKNVSVPTSIGTVTTRASAKSHIVSVPFSSISNSLVVSNGAGYGAFLTASSLDVATFDLNPVTNVAGGFQNNAFGIGVANIAKAYARYRVKKLRVTYVPTVSTSTGGSVILGALTENYLATAATPQIAADCQASITTPV
jgi:hypothetical protein